MSEADQVLMTWSTEPTIWVGIALLVALYFLASGPWRSRIPGSQPIARGQKAWFLFGILIMWFALVSPLDQMSDEYLFSAHMVQHILLTLVAPPLLLVGTPGWMLRPLLRNDRVKRVARVLTVPLVAFAGFNLDFMIWHVPSLYQATLEHQAIHIVEHLLFIGTAFLNWWPILSPFPELPRLPYPAQILYLFLDAVPSTVLGAIFVFASSVMYPTYAAAPRIFGVGALDDQMFGGLIMAMPGGMIYLVALSIIFFLWLGREDHAEDSGILVRP